MWHLLYMVCSLHVGTGDCLAGSALSSEVRGAYATQSECETEQAKYEGLVNAPHRGKVLFIKTLCVPTGS